MEGSAVAQKTGERARLVAAHEGLYALGRDQASSLAVGLSENAGSIGCGSHDRSCDELQLAREVDGGVLARTHAELAIVDLSLDRSSRQVQTGSLGHGDLWFLGSDSEVHDDDDDDVLKLCVCVYY